MQERNFSGQKDNMINKLTVKNFKSLKDFEITCKKINIFIGEPNTGKSNILESLGFFSFIAGYFTSWEESMRIFRCIDIFFDNNIKEEAIIQINESPFIIKYKNGQLIFTFEGKSNSVGVSNIYELPARLNFSEEFKKKFEYIKFYRFKIRKNFPNERVDFLLPSGENLFTILYTSPSLRKIIAGLFKNYEIVLDMDSLSKQLNIGKVLEEAIIVKLPYTSLSDTLQRVIYYICAIETNKNSVLIFEEPESHAFPYYTKYLAERIAFDKENQYFITTHNPYFLLSLIEKVQKEDIAIFITFISKGKTKAKKMPEEKIEEILSCEEDIFFNLDNFLK